MNKQIELLKEVRKRFPKSTYRELGELFGISTTRFFRLINGSEMRASEYFMIRSKLEEDSSEISMLITFLEKHSLSLSRNDCTNILSELENKLYIRELAAR